MGISDEAVEELRLRQVHQFLSFNPSGYSSRKTAPDISATKVTSPNTPLTAFTQLVALRLNAQRAIISLVDRDDQYFLAESTQTLDLMDGERSDWLWMGCSGSTPRNEALCAQTITAPPPEQGYSSYCVLDLTKHPVFGSLPYVKGPPNFRFYAGTPLISLDGFRIGSLFIIDDRPRESNLEASEVNFLGMMAANVMKYMEMQKEAQERQRIATMSKGLAAFTEGRHRIPTEWKASSDSQTGTSNNHARNIDLRRHAPKEENSTKSLSERIENTANAEKDHKLFSKPTKQPHRVIDVNGNAQTHASILAKASNLLRESLDVDFTLFLDVKAEVSPNSSTVNPEDRENAEKQPEKNSPSTDYVPALSNKQAKVLSFSTKKASSSGQDDVSKVEFRTMSLRMVKRLVRKYAKGYLWSFDENGRAVQARDEALDIESDSTGTTSSDSDGKGTYEKYSRIKEFEAVTSCFPGVRQILFAPIFDPATSNCIYASFAVSLREVPVFTTDIEVAYTRAFLNNVGVEWDRVTVSIADRTKGDFLSSISHEFRSPLHGILASTELLSDSELDTSQRGLCDTILMCGSTLLNTVSHILDYSMINDLSYHRSNKNKSIELQGGSGTATPLEGTRLGPLSPIGLYLDVDVAWICEAVVQTVCAGFAHDHSTPGSHVLHNSQAIGGVDGSGDLKPQTGAQPVMVILDVLPSDWRFATAPGAIQRVLMNLVGNSLKYTTAGFVKIELKVESDTHSKIGDDTHLVTMTVSDSGIGISQDFIRHKLYAPFTQESTLAPGTGLGLSMVKKIVHALRGEIGIQSQQNEGTQVTVRIPLMSAGRQNPPSLTTSPDLKVTDNPILILRAECVKKSVMIYGLQSPANGMLRESIELYITKWYEFRIVEDLSLADFIIVDESAFETFLSVKATPLTPRVVVLRYASVKYTSESMDTHDVLKPIGPYRLAKGLHRSWIGKPTSSLARSLSLSQQAADPGSNPVVEEVHRMLPGLSNVGQMALDRGPSASPYIVSAGLHSKPLTLRYQEIVTKDSSQNLAPVRSSQPQILCVDDNQINLKLLQAYLKKLGFTNIHCAENGLEAFNLVETSPFVFNLIFMDISMPICDGFESTRMIRRLEKQRNKLIDHASVAASIIALTGQASNRDQVEAFASGMDCFVTKPMSLARLKELVADWDTKGASNSPLLRDLD